MKVLILDDDRISCQMYKIYLSRFFEIHTVSDAESFNAFFDESQADIALIDVNIKNPEYTGLDLAQLLKDNDKVGNTKFLAMTAYDSYSINIPAWMHGYVQKPVDLPNLKTILTDIANTN